LRASASASRGKKAGAEGDLVEQRLELALVHAPFHSTHSGHLVHCQPRAFSRTGGRLPGVKAAIFAALGKPLVIESVPDPTPAAGQVVVRVSRCGICGSDLHLTEDPFFGLPPGAILGHEYAGEVVGVGRDVQRVRVGDRVSVMPIHGCWRCASCVAGEPAWCTQMRIDGGGYGEYSLANEAQCLSLPVSVTLEDGALVEPLAVGLHGVTVAQLTPGARVLVIGAGPIGLATAFWARRLGAGRVAVTASSNRRESLAYALGATAFIDPADSSQQAVNRALGAAPDVVFECVGKPGLLARSIEYARPRGTVVILGLCTAIDSLMPFAVVSKEVRLQPAAFYSMRDFEIAADALAANNAVPRAMVTDTVSLDDMPAAFEALRQRNHQCKVMVRPGAS
jgi:(R,R)-butanediol dehydrogenase/meso-butanediol dehydrogenase/diacetyl reductase